MEEHLLREISQEYLIPFFSGAKLEEQSVPSSPQEANVAFRDPVSIASSTKDCRACALKPRCTKGAKRIITRNLFEAEREHVRALKGTETFERSAQEQRKVEMAFAHLKRNLGFRRLRLRGITGAADEFLLAATVQNLKKLVRFRPIARRWPHPARSEAENQNPKLSDEPIGGRGTILSPSQSLQD
jgi:hypothetical protein